MEGDDLLKSALDGLDKPDGVYIRLPKKHMRFLITHLAEALRDDEPQVGSYGEQELRYIVTKFKSHLHDDPGTYQEEEVRAYNTQC
jgi:hypothetical protein